VTLSDNPFRNAYKISSGNLPDELQNLALAVAQQLVDVVRPSRSQFINVLLAKKPAHLRTENEHPSDTWWMTAIRTACAESMRIPPLTPGRFEPTDKGIHVLETDNKKTITD
jgi:hypothetical protein